MRYLIVDELHTFDGAQGADLALLISVLNIVWVRQKITSSVSVHGNSEVGRGRQSCVEYGETIFGEPFVGDAVVRETRLGPSEALDADDLLALPQQETIENAILEAEDLDQPNAAKVLTDALFSEEPTSPESALQLLEQTAPDSIEFRLELGKVLKQSRPSAW